MPLVLALEPDPRQAEALKTLVERRVSAEFLLADSKDAAIAAIAERVPDLILVTALLSPRDESELTDHLRSLDGAAHLQTLTIPLLSGVALPAPAKRRRGLFAALQRHVPDKPTAGCDPVVFADQIRSYLERAQELRAEAAEHRAVQRTSEAVRGVDAGARPPAARPAEAAEPAREATSSYWDWDAPSDAGRSFSTSATADEPAAAIDEHPLTVIDAGDALLGRPSGAEESSPLDALVREAIDRHDVVDPFAGHDASGASPDTDDLAFPDPDATPATADVERKARGAERRRTREVGRRARVAREVEEQLEARSAAERERTEAARREIEERERAAREAETRARLRPRGDRAQPCRARGARGGPRRTARQRAR